MNPVFRQGVESDYHRRCLYIYFFNNCLDGVDSFSAFMISVMKAGRSDGCLGLIGDPPGALTISAGLKQLS